MSLGLGPGPGIVIEAAGCAVLGLVEVRERLTVESRRRGTTHGLAIQTVQLSIVEVGPLALSDVVSVEGSKVCLREESAITGIK